MPGLEFPDRQKDLVTRAKHEDIFSNEIVSDEDKRTRDDEKEKELFLQSELIAKGEEFGNNFEFLNPKLKYSEVDLPKEINTKVFEPGYNEETLKRINDRFQAVANFLSAPMILDKFGDDHVARREWEDKYLKNFSPEAQEYYNTNRLGLNHSNKIIPLWKTIKEFNEYPKEYSEINIKAEYLNKIDGFMSQIPKSIDNLEPLPYASLSLSSKVRDIEDLSLVILAFVRTLGEPRKE